jgi:hypothetical protein
MIDFLKSIGDQFVVIAGRLWEWFLLTDVGLWFRTYGEWLGLVLFIVGAAGAMLWMWRGIKNA